MAHRTTLHYSEALLRQAVLAFWRRFIGVGFVAAMVLVAVGVAALLVQGDRSWFTGTLATVMAFGVLIAVALYVVPLRDCLRGFRKMVTPEATFVAEESTFTFSSDYGSSTVKWSAITEIWRFKSFWLLSLSKAQFITVPLVDVPPEMQSYILERVEAAGGKVGA